MPAADTLSVSRRQFLAGCAGCAAAAATPAMAETPSIESSPRSLGSRGDISPEGRASIAEVDRRFEQQHGQIQRTIDPVAEWGLDPNGNTPVGGKLASKISGLSNVRVVFPSDGTFLFTEQSVWRPSGPVELIGNGCTFKLDASMEQPLLNIDQFPSGSLLKGFTFASTGDTAFSIRVATEGTVKVKNITIKGYMVSDQSNPQRVQGTFAPVAYTESATVRATNITAIGGTAAGTHDQNDKPESATVNQLASPMGIWVGQSTQGTIQLVKCQFRGWSNGVYGGRTHGTVGVYGGEYWNNINSQLRLGGGSVVDGATLLLDDRKWSMQKNPGPFSLGEKQGVYAIRVDPSNIGNHTDPLRIRNTEAKAVSMGGGGSVIDVEDHAGPVLIENSRLMNHLDRPIIYGAAPVVGGPTNIMLRNSLVGGSSPQPVTDINERPQSRVSRTCVTIPNAGPDDINGAEIGQGVSFGQCKGSGLTAPKKVGSAGNISSLPAPSYNGSAGVEPAAGRSARARKAGIVKAMVTTVLMVIVSIVGIVGGVLAFAALIAGLSSVLVYLLIDEK
jgi:hypothetical protein